VLTVPAFADTTAPVQAQENQQTTTAQATPEAQPASLAATTETSNSQTTQGLQTEAATITTTTVTHRPGITPDSSLYALDRLAEKIQLALITDAVKGAELLARISLERLAESNAMMEKANVELAQKALNEYKVNLEKAVSNIEAAIEEGKQVAIVMESINSANIKDAAIVDKILVTIPEEYRNEVKTELEKLAVAAQATTEVAQVIENKVPEENSVKAEITMKYIEETVQDAVLSEKIKAAGLNTRQVIVVISLAEQANKPLGEVIDLFVAKEKGIGATAHALGLNTKDALKGINSSFKDAKATIKKAFKEAIKVVEKADKMEIEAIVNCSLADVDKKEEVKKVNEKLQKVVEEAKSQVEAITAATKSKKAEKAVEKAEKKIKKAIEKVEKSIEKADKKADKDNSNKGKKENNRKSDKKN
jgi:hypothetical protein